MQHAPDHDQARSALDEMRKAVTDPSGVLADSFISSVASGAPCGTDVLERSGVAATARISAAENDVRVWKQTHDECAQVSRSKEALALQAKSRVARCAREVIANSATAMRLMDDLEMKQAEVIARRVALRFIWGKGLNGELSGPDKDRIESLLRQDLTGWESHPVHGVWRAAFEELQSNHEAELPS